LFGLRCFEKVEKNEKVEKKVEKVEKKVEKTCFFVKAYYIFFVCGEKLLNYVPKIWRMHVAF
jgi:hypothetical protein